MLDIKSYESMAKLDLPSDERELIAAKLNELMASFKALDGIDASGALPLTSVLNVQNVLRDDVHHKLLSRDELLENAPEQYNGYFQVPRTID